MSFYSNFIRICEEKGLKITNITEECGGSSGSISGWKKGKYPRSDFVLRVSSRLGVSCDALLRDDNENIKSPSSEISENGRKMLALFEQLPESEQWMLIGRLQEMTEPTVRQTSSGESTEQTEVG